MSVSYRQLGRSGTRVSSLCLGTMNFGPRTDEAASHAILDRAIDAGINFVDTANQYGGECGVGTTESIVGSWLAASGKRDDIVLATKVHEPMGTGPNEHGLSAYHIRRACEASLKRLGTDHIDLYQVHHLDRTTPWDEIWQAMDTLITQGKITYVGSSNLPGWSIATANLTAQQRSSLGLVTEQSLYHLAERSVELEVIPACEAYGLGLLPWSPLGGGLLAGAPSSEGGRRSDLGTADPRLAAQLDAYQQFCDELGEPPAVVALAWLLHQPAVTAPVVGPRTQEQLESAIAATDLVLDDDALRALDEIWPGPGPAPEAYAW